MGPLGQNLLIPGNLAVPIAKVVGLLVAISLGALVGRGEFGDLTRALGAMFAVVFVTHLHRYFWHAALFLIFFNFTYRPTGFAFTALELSCLLGAGVVLISVWQKRPLRWPHVVPRREFSVLRAMLLIWVAYVCGHMLHTFQDPFSPPDFSRNNALKAYFALLAPYVLLLYFSGSPASVHPGREYFWRICQLCFVGLSVALVLRAYEILTGSPSVFIPWINAMNSIYTLRFVGPLSMVLGAVALSSKRFVEFSPSKRTVCWLLLGLGAVGAIFSGGRASVVVGLASVFLALALRRKYAVLVTGLILGIFGIIAANIASNWINTDAPPMVQRSLQWVLVNKSAEAAGSIENSSDWRRELFRRTVAEWQSHPRIFWFGRATYAFGSEDESVIFALGGYEGLIQTSLRRGATHNLVGDLLIAYGLIGCVIYLSLYASVLWFLWRMFRSDALSDSARDLALVCFVSALFVLLVGVVAGGVLGLETIFCMIVLIAAVYKRVALSEKANLVLGTGAPAQERPEVEPKRARPSSSPRRVAPKRRRVGSDQHRA